MWDSLARASGLEAEHLHLLLNHIPIIGLMAGTGGLFLSLLVRSTAARNISLFIIGLTALAAWPVFEFGDIAYDRITGIVDDVGNAWLDEHLRRAQQVFYGYFVLSAAAALAIVTTRRYPAVSRVLAVISLGLALGMTAAGGWVAYPGGKVIHQEIRSEPPPEAD